MQLFFQVWKARKLMALGQDLRNTVFRRQECRMVQEVLKAESFLTFEVVTCPHRGVQYHHANAVHLKTKNVGQVVA